MTQREARAFVYRWLAVTCAEVEVCEITDGVLKPQAEKAITQAFEDICDMLHGKADRLNAMPATCLTLNMIAAEHKGEDQ
jgi:hypothetical protein